MASEIKKKKVSQLPEASTLNGFFAFGTDGSNTSVKVPMGLLRGNSPHIGANGNWYVGDIDTGVHAQGEPGNSPHVGSNGNWWVGTTDTGVKAGELAQVKETTDGKILFQDETGNILLEISSIGNIDFKTLDRIIGLIEYIKKHANAQIQETEDGRFLVVDELGNEAFSIEFDGKIKMVLDQVVGLKEYIEKLIPSSQQETSTSDSTVTVLKPGDFDSPGFRIPFCTITTKGTIIVGCEARYDGGASDHQLIDTVIKRSTDRGLTFDSGQIVHKNNGIVANSRKMNPVICVDEITGRIYLFAHNIDVTEAWENSTIPDWYLTAADLIYKYSDDDGVTWSAEISLKTTHPEIFPADCVSLFPATGQGITMIDGTLVIPCQVKQPTLYAGTEIDSSKIFNIQSCFIYLTPQNKKTQTWQRSALVPTLSSENMIAEYDQGKLMINCRNGSGLTKRRVFITSDLGITWTADSSDKTILEPSINGGCQGTLFKARLGNDLFRKSYGLFLNPQDATTRLNITLQASSDFHTWHPVKVLYDQYSFGYTCLAQRDNLLIAVLEKSDNNIVLFLLDSTKNIITQKIWD